MAVKITKDTTSLRPRSRFVDVVVDPQNEELGTVRVVLCEVPSGLLEELQGETVELGEEVKELNRNIATARRRRFALEEALTSGSWPPGEPSPVFDASSHRAELVSIDARVGELKAKRKEARDALTRKRMELIAWGICDHRAEDFLDEQGEPVAFQSSVAVYDNYQYMIVHPEIVRGYASVGTTLIESLHNAISNYQNQQVYTPRLIWDESRKAKELLESRLEAILSQQVNKALADVTGTPEDKAAELGAEVSDPNAKRPTTTETTTAQ